MCFTFGKVDDIISLAYEPGDYNFHIRGLEYLRDALKGGKSHLKKAHTYTVERTLNFLQKGKTTHASIPEQCTSDRCLHKPLIYTRSIDKDGEHWEWLCDGCAKKSGLLKFFDAEKEKDSENDMKGCQ